MFLRLPLSADDVRFSSLLHFTGHNVNQDSRFRKHGAQLYSRAPEFASSFFLVGGRTLDTRGSTYKSYKRAQLRKWFNPEEIPILKNN